VIFEVNPGAVYVEVVRAALIDEPRGHHLWLLAVAWAVVVLAAGYLFFWQAEEQYGRV
jgi:teichoic acid transport system permease protein